MSKPWIETIGLALGALLLGLLAMGSGQHAQHGDAFVPLFPEGVPSPLAIGDPLSHQINWTSHGPLLLDADGTPTARLDPASANRVAEVLGSCRILRTVTVQELGGDAAAYGLDKPAIIHVGDQRLAFGSAGTDRGYLQRADGRIHILDRDPAALLGRPVDTLRLTSLAFPAVVNAVTGSSGWRMHTDRQRWWLSTATKKDQWTDGTIVTTWLKALINAPVIGYDKPAEEVERASLTFHGKDDQGRPAALTLVDLGPDRSGRARHLRRDQVVDGVQIREHLLIRIAAELIDPDPAALVTTTLLPIDPRRAKRVVLGAVELDREHGRWLLNGIDDADQQQLNGLLKRLAELKRLKNEPAADGSTAVQVADDLDSFTLPYNDPRLADLLSRLQPFHFRDRSVLAGIRRPAITGIVFSPADRAPQIYSRSPDEPWSADIREDLEPFLDLLTSLQVERWTGALAADAKTPFAVESSINIATADGRLTVRLDSDGNVFVPERGLVGRLDASSRRRFLE